MPLWARPAAAAGPPTLRARPGSGKRAALAGSTAGSGPDCGVAAVGSWCGMLHGARETRLDSARPKPGECGPPAAQTRTRVPLSGRVMKDVFASHCEARRSQAAASWRELLGEVCAGLL